MVKDGYVLKARNIVKKFGKVVALKGVDIGIKKNEVVGLLGDNGAGKSTLVKVLAGVHQPDGGEIYFKGEKIENLNPRKIHQMDIEVVHQDLALSPQQSIAKNMYMGREKTNSLGFLKKDEQRDETDRLMREILGFTSEAFTPETKVEQLSGGERQGVQIARAMYFEADLVILDEPTIQLSITETEKVMNFVRKLTEKGGSCLIISHNVSDVYSVSDRFVVLDRGRVADKFEKKGRSLEDLFEKMREAVKGTSQE